MQTSVCILLLSLLVLLVHGFHPAAEDGGIYAAGIFLKLDPSLFAHDAEFVRAPMAYSQFAWSMAGLCRLLHVAPFTALLLTDVFTTALTLFGAERLCRRLGFSLSERLGAIALLAAWWTLPVAGTSLSIGDPYVTARSFSTPFTLFAVSFALSPPKRMGARSAWTTVAACLLFLALTFVMHRLMFGFAAMFALIAQASAAPDWKKAFGSVCLGSLVCCLILQSAGPPESQAFLHAELTRNYWFLSQWHWYEVCGLVAPIVCFSVVTRQSSEPEKTLARAALFAGMLSVAVAALFARESSGSHLIARLQPLRMFALLYILMTLLLGAGLVRFVRSFAARLTLTLPRNISIAAVSVVYVSIALVMFAVQRDAFGSSRHIELPWSEGTEPNPWVAAFQWCRTNTAKDSLFALDAAYIHDPNNDAQTFRANALRSALSDQSKDGGEAAVAPELAETWLRGFDAQANLNQEPDAKRRARLSALGVDWVILSSTTETTLRCPYSNSTVKICRLR